MEEKFYITSSIAYANSGPHMGYTYEVVLADIIARYKRQKGINTFFLTGTDEHGDKIIRSAQKSEIGPQAFVDSNVLKFKELDNEMNISYDFFIRTSDKKNHWSGAQALWAKLLASGDIYKGVYKGLYCVGCEAFVTEKDLNDGKCPNHDVSPEEIEEENYFFKLSKYTKEIKSKIVSGELEIIPIVRKNEILTLLDDGLRDISISRPEGNIPWGVPVPNEKGQMMYVWFEALVNYISALGFGREDSKNFEVFWPADVHVIGKDILRFHSAVWPAMLLSAEMGLPKKILVHGFITSEGKKMSKSLGNVINPLSFLKDHSAESLRYYLSREISPFEDGDFTEKRFIETYNANLANGLGNLVSRTLKMSQQYFDGNISRKTNTDVPLKREFKTLGEINEVEGFSIPYTVVNDIKPVYYKNMDSFNINTAADEIWKLISLLDGYIADYEPFKLIKKDKEKTENIIWNVLFGLYHISDMLNPFMPDTSEKIKELIGVSFGEDGVPVSFNTNLPEAPLFLRK